MEIIIDLYCRASHIAICRQNNMEAWEYSTAIFRGVDMLVEWGRLGC